MMILFLSLGDLWNSSRIHQPILKWGNKQILTYVETGNFLQRQFVELSFDDVFSNGNSGFFTSESIYGTNLTGFATLYSNFIHYVPTDPYKLDADDSVLDAMVKLEKGLEFSAGLSTSYLVEDNVVTENDAERILKSKYALEVSDIGNTYVSSYSVFSLPSLEQINNGWYVTIKSENIALFIYIPRIEVTYLYLQLMKKLLLSFCLKQTPLLH